MPSRQGCRSSGYGSLPVRYPSEKESSRVRNTAIDENCGTLSQVSDFPLAQFPLPNQSQTPMSTDQAPPLPAHVGVGTDQASPSHPNVAPNQSDISDPHYSRLGSGRPYNFFTPHILQRITDSEPKLRAFNNAASDDERQAALKALLGEVGEECLVVPPLYVEWGSHVMLGKGVYLGCGVNMQDTGGGDYTMIGPSTTIATVSHPLNPTRRGHKSPELSKPVRIGSNVWIGAGVTILGGVVIGDGAVIGAGAVVTKNVGANELWVGIPARKVREGLDGVDDGIDWDEVPPM